MKLGRLQFQKVHIKHFRRRERGWFFFTYHSGYYRLIRVFGIQVLIWQRGYLKKLYKRFRL